jgi:hypothetical protein
VNQVRTFAGLEAAGSETAGATRVQVSNYKAIGEGPGSAGALLRSSNSAIKKNDLDEKALVMNENKAASSTVPWIHDQNGAS